MRAPRIITAAVSLALLALPVAGATATSAAAAETATTAVTIQLDKRLMRYADTFNIQGQVVATMSDGAQGWLADAPVALQRKFPGKAWKTIARATTSSSYGDGAYHFYSVRAQQNASYRTRYAGETRSFDGGELTFGGSTSPTRGIRVARDFDLSSAKRNGRIYFMGKVLPSYRSKVVEVQRRTCQRCRWRPYTKVRTNQRSRFSLRVAVPRSGSWHYRVRTPKSTAFVASTSSRYLTVYRY